MKKTDQNKLNPATEELVPAPVIAEDPDHLGPLGQRLADAILGTNDPVYAWFRSLFVLHGKEINISDLCATYRWPPKMHSMIMETASQAFRGRIKVDAINQKMIYIVGDLGV